MQQEQARLQKFCVQNSLSAPTQVFEECGVQGVMCGAGFGLVQSNP